MKKEIKNAMNRDLVPGLWLIKWDNAVQTFEFVTECFMNHRNHRRLKTLSQKEGKLPQKDFNDWMLSKNMEATATFIGDKKDHPEYYL